MKALVSIRLSGALALSALLALLVASLSPDIRKDRRELFLVDSVAYDQQRVSILSHSSNLFWRILKCPSAWCPLKQVQSLLGYDSGGDPNVIGAFESDEDSSKLPKWATSWTNSQSSNGAYCESGKGLATQCNPVGMLGFWVMKKTEPKYNPPRRSDDAARLKDCSNLPGWALHECLRMREKESKLP
jgi:hypothetical protein